MWHCAPLSSTVARNPKKEQITMADADQSGHEGAEAVELPRPTDADIEALENKLQQLRIELEPGERNAFSRLLALAATGNEAAKSQAADEDVQGYMSFFDSFLLRSPTYRSSFNRVSLNSYRTVLAACGAGTCAAKCKKVELSL
jgi:hypothetical protein